MLKLKISFVLTLGSIPRRAYAALCYSNFNTTLYADDGSNHYLNTLRSCNISHSFQSYEEQSFIKYIYDDVFNYLKISLDTKD